jgi:hypothetical protein
MNRYPATTLIFDLTPGHSDITSFVHGHQSCPIETHLDRTEKTKCCPDDWLGTVDSFSSTFGHFGTHLREKIPHVQIFNNDGPNPLMLLTLLLSCSFSRNIDLLKY